ncbi:fasciclin-2-like isoform X3 [Macrobrachium nipponense]|uniref:fasciclin-2-like isoform X3 n=1 Tax=Macrobrachium nipponense TaxID=159736 RepID=UPI0030C8A3C7
MAYHLDMMLLTLSVAQGPSLQLLPASILKALNDDVYVSCTANVDDPDLVTEMKWVGPNGQAIPNDDNTIITMEGIGGPGKLDLMINKLQEKDTGIYNCTAIYAGNQKLSAELMVEAFLDIDFGDTPGHQTPFIGTESKIRCTPVAKPAPRVDWLKDSIPLRNDDNHIIQQDGVLIKKVTEADEGIYRCRARVPEIGSIDYRDIQVEVYVPPQINIAPENVTGVEKETVTFKCGANGKPQPVYSWVNKDNEPLEDREGYFVDPEKGVLTIMELKPELGGTYRCTAKNPAGEDTAKANLLVLTKPKVETFLNITQAVDLNAEMRCVATGSPLPKIIFKKESNEDSFQDGINVDDRIEIEQAEDEEGRRVGILKIRGVHRSDDGLYTCTAKSEGGTTQVWGHITVEFPPTFEEEVKTEEWTWEQAPVNLTCLATAIPNATIQWYFRNVEISALDENLKILSYGPLGVLNINPSQSYYGTYTCEATNKLGRAEHNLELREAHVPGPVSGAEILKKSATTITWNILDPASNGGLPIQSYIVEYWLRNSGIETAKTKIWTKGSTYTLESLQPLETYIFRFAAKNEAGRGEWSGDKVEEMPKRAAPEEPWIYNSDSLVVENPYKDEYKLQWSVPLDNGEPIDHFSILYFQVHNTSGKWINVGEKLSDKSKYPGPTEFTIKDLDPDTHYKIELRAHNEIGYSTPAEIVIKTAHDPSSMSGTGGKTTYSSVAPSTTTPAHDPVGPQPSTGGVGTGLIVGIIVIVVLIVIVVADVICYCTKNAGLTAAIVGKRGSKDKDKEAMLEDGKNASADTLNEESKDETKPLDEKPLPEKEVPKDLEKKVDIISEKETDEKHEGNGEMKPVKEEDAKPVQQESDEKAKEVTEPTETTPMIQGSLHVNNSPVNSKFINVHHGKIWAQMQKQSLQTQTPTTRIRRTPHHLVDNYRRSYSESHYLEDIPNSFEETSNDLKNTSTKMDSNFSGSFKNAYEEIGYGQDGHPLSWKLAMENPVFNASSRLQSSKSTPALDYDSDSSVDSTYDVPFKVKVPIRYSYTPEPSVLCRNRQVKPPLPVRNPETKLTCSHENLLSNGKNRYMPSFTGSQCSLKASLYEEVKDPEDSEFEVMDSRSKIRYVMSSKEALDRLSVDALGLGTSRESISHNHLKSPSNASMENFVAKFIPQSTYQPPSQNSYTTFYQPNDAPFYLKKPKVAFGIAEYDKQMKAQPTIANKVVEIPTKKPRQFETQDGEFSSPLVKISNQKSIVISQPRKPKVPPPPVPAFKKPSTPVSEKSNHKTVTTLYFVERPKYPNLSQSVDRLDDGFYSPPEESSSPLYVQSSMSSARSLGSLLSSERSQRSYNQPTLI